MAKKKKAVKKAAPKANLTPFKQAVIDYAIGVTRAYQKKWFKDLDAKLKKLEKMPPEMLALAGHFRTKNYNCRDKKVKELTALILKACGVKTPIPSGELGYPHKDMDGELPFLGVVVQVVSRDHTDAPMGQPLISVHQGGNFGKMLTKTGRQVVMSEYQDHHRPASDGEIRQLIMAMPAAKVETKLGHLGAFFKNVSSKGKTFTTGGKKKPPTEKKKVAKKRGRR